MMDRLEMMRIAETELGLTATAEQMASFIRERFGENIGAKFIPIIRAGLRGQEALQEARKHAARILAEEPATSSKPKVRPKKATGSTLRN